jgi:hypothetical protein
MAHIIRADYFDPDPDLFVLTGFDGRKRRQALTACTFDPAAKLIFSLPCETSNVYVCITDGEPAILRQLIATLEDYDAQGECNHFGTVHLFADPVLNSNGVCGVLLLQGSIYNALEHVPDEAIIDGRTVQFLGVVLLSKAEYKLWSEAGLDALLEYFEKAGKDLVRLQQMNN